MPDFKRHGVLGSLLILVVAGCAVSLPIPDRSASGPQVFACQQWMSDLDAAIARAGVQDASAYRVPGMPYLRSDRYTASLADIAAGSPAAFADWIARLRGLAQEGYRAEIGNLPAADALSLGAGESELNTKVMICGDALAAADMTSAGVRQRLLASVAVPDEYSGWKRFAGLYALTRIPFSSGVDRWHKEAVEMIEREKQGRGDRHPVLRYGPDSAARYSAGAAGALLQRVGRDSLGIPLVSARDAEALLDWHAPVFEVQTTGAFDRIGMPVWRDGMVPDADVSRPIVLRRIAYTRHGSATLVQLVYTIWFSERPSDAGLDILAGRLDGLVWRVTLTPDGEPWVYDAMHPCGCFHLFFPTSRAEALPAPKAGDEWAFVPATAPQLADGDRIRLRIATRTHYLLDVGIDRSAWDVRYGSASEDSLRSLAAPDGGRRSLYGPDGLVAGTERTERFLFWPMGISSAGAMRQWGKHATAFLGRRHFDDADLIERRFRLLPR